jgi:hypothetical protein
LASFSISIPSCFSASCNTYFIQIIFIFVQPSLSWLSNGLFPSGMFLTRSSGILSDCPNHRNLPFLMSEIMSGSLNRCTQIHCISRMPSL